MPAEDAPRPAAPDAAPAGPVFDSRTWTGPRTVPEPAPHDVLAARAVFAEAGGPEATLPRRAASAVSWAGLVLLPIVVLLAADARVRTLGLDHPGRRPHRRRGRHPPDGAARRASRVQLAGAGPSSVPPCALIGAAAGGMAAGPARGRCARAGRGAAGRSPHRRPVALRRHLGGERRQHLGRGGLRRPGAAARARPRGAPGRTGSGPAARGHRDAGREDGGVFRQLGLGETAAAQFVPREFVAPMPPADVVPTGRR